MEVIPFYRWPQLSRWLITAAVWRQVMYSVLFHPTCAVSMNPTRAPTISNIRLGCDMLSGQTWTATDSWQMQITFFEGLSDGGIDYGHFAASYGQGKYSFDQGSIAYCGYARSGYVFLNCYTGTPYSYVAQLYACYYYVYVYNSSLCYGCGANSIYASPTNLPSASPTIPTSSPTTRPTHPTAAPTASSPTRTPTISNMPSGCDMLYGQTWTTTDSWQMQITFFEGLSDGGIDYGHFAASYGHGEFYFNDGSTANCGYARSGYIFLNCYTGTPYSYVAQQYACYYYVYVYNSSLCYGCGADSVYSGVPTKIPTLFPVALQSSAPTIRTSSSTTDSHQTINSLIAGVAVGGAFIIIGVSAYYARLRFRSRRPSQVNAAPTLELQPTAPVYEFIGKESYCVPCAEQEPPILVEAYPVDDNMLQITAVGYVQQSL
jgi:hypothetical protein